LKKSSEQCSGAAVEMGRAAAASEETICEERMAGGV
jgi:hypothetical protein